MSITIEQSSVREKLYQQTLKEVADSLKEHKKCMIIRPTGFGKTYLMANLTKAFKSPLYLYPLDIIRLDINTKYKDITNKNTKYMSYRKLLNLYKADKENITKIVNKFDLILLDEAHMAGAEQTSEAIKDIISKAKGNYFVGATATPDRSDGFDITAEFFSNIELSEYTLHNAIEDGLIPKPYYVYSLYDTKESIKGIEEEIKRTKNKNSKESLLEKLKAAEVEMGNLINATSVIKENIKAVYTDGLDYMKFIVFFSEKATLAVRRNDVENWFKEAYPDMHIRNLVITSDIEYAKNIHKLDNLRSEANTIDLIYCIDMLNMGYHIEDLTGIIMLRGTSSNIIYKQQVGRCLSAASSNTPIIFDFVNNIFRKPYFGEYKANGGVNKDELSTKGSRLNDLQARDLIINDRVASQRRFLDKMIYEVESIRLEEAMYLYVERSMPMKVLVKEVRLREDYIRKEFTRRGIVMDD